MLNRNKKGFTIVELVIVIAVIAILAGVLIPTFAGIISKANESKALQESQNAIKVVVTECVIKGITVPQATVYYFDKAATEDDAKVIYTAEYANGKLGEITPADDITYDPSNACYAKSKDAIEDDKVDSVTELSDLPDNIVVVTDAFVGPLG